MIRSVAALAALTALAGPALAQDAAPLSPGKPVRGTLPDQGRIWRSYRIEVPEGATALDLRVTANGDADLYARALSPMENRWSERADASSAGPDGTERIRLTPEDGLCACVYYVDVVHGDGAAGRTLKYTLKAAIERGDANGAPPPDGERFAASATDDAAATFSSDFSVDVDLTRGDDNYVTYRVDVGPDVSEVRLALTGARADLGLYAHYGAAMPNWFSAHHRARSSGLDKTLVLSRDGVPRLRTGVYYVDVGRGPDGGSTATLSGTFIRGFDGEEAPGRLPDASTEADVTGEIRTDSAFRVSLDEGPRYRTYLIHVPPQAQSLTVRETGANGDVDLYLRHGAPIADYSEDPDHRANGTRFEEQLYVDRRSNPPLRPGRYFLDVVRATSEGDIGPIDLEVLYDAPEPPPLPAVSGPLREIALGERISVDLGEEGRKGARFHFVVPDRARSLDIRVLGATRDIDLFVRKGEVITDHNDSAGFDAKVVSARLNEHLTLDRTTDPPLSGGDWYLDVASLITSDVRIAFDLIVTVDEDADVDDIAFPPYFDAAELTPIERVLQSVVQVSSENGSGSGTCISPWGHIITNHHVIESDGAVQMDDIYISFVRDFDEPPEQIFVAEVLELDEELDLALLKVRSDIYDRPLPRHLDLPHLPLGDPDDLHHGDIMYIAGFPSVGGFESRTSLSLTRGIVSGFVTDPSGERVWIKTDARINAGNSGGTALDGDLTYVGVPSRERVSDDDELGYSRPTTTIPAAWLERIQP